MFDNTSFRMRNVTDLHEKTIAGGNICGVETKDTPLALAVAMS